MRDILKTLLNTYGATGREEKIRAAIRAMVAPYVDEIEEDALGNLICVRHGEGARVMLAAHMDQIGFMVMDIDEKGFLRVTNVGGIRRNNSLNRHVVFENGVHGVVSNEVERFDPKENDMAALFIDIGAKSREAAEKRISVGDVAVYAPDAYEMGDDLMASPAMDNRVGCAVLIDALRRLKSRNNDIYAVFTTQEEVGLRGARTAAYRIDPQLAVALDVTPAGDTPKGLGYPIAVGEGPCVKIVDRSVVCSPKVVRLMDEAAESANVRCQREVLVAGGTDAGAIQQVRAGVPCGVLSIACRYVHSACEVVSISDAEKGAAVLAELMDGRINL